MSGEVFSAFMPWTILASVFCMMAIVGLFIIACAKWKLIYHAWWLRRRGYQATQPHDEPAEE
jgi:hypothetical protein